LNSSGFAFGYAVTLFVRQKVVEQTQQKQNPLCFSLFLLAVDCQHVTPCEMHLTDYSASAVFYTKFRKTENTSEAKIRSFPQFYVIFSVFHASMFLVSLSNAAPINVIAADHTHMAKISLSSNFMVSDLYCLFLVKSKISRQPFFKLYQLHARKSHPAV